MVNRTGFFKEYGVIKPPIEREVLAKQIYEVLKDIKLEGLIDLITNRFEETLQYAELSQGKNTCQRMSLLFNPHRLMIGGRKSIYNSMKDKKFSDNLSRAILWRKYDSNRPNNLLYSIFELGTGGRQFANEFLPHITRDLVVKYGGNSASRVLDPCAGWGGRMIGVSVITDYYECFEPSTLTYNGLNKLSEFLSMMNPGFLANIHHGCFEDSNLENESFDFAITSPPYYDTEVYSDEETNSCNRYSNFDEWVKGFYLPLIQKTIFALRPGKTFILNIGSRKYPLNKILMDNFSSYYSITREKNFLSLRNLGGKKDEGEAFYAIRKT